MWVDIRYSYYLVYLKAAAVALRQPPGLPVHPGRVTPADAALAALDAALAVGGQDLAAQYRHLNRKKNNFK